MISLRKFLPSTTPTRAIATLLLAVFLLIPIAQSSVAFAAPGDPASTTQDTQASTDSTIDNLYDCNFVSGGLGGWLGCVVGGTYYIVYKPMLFVFGWAGNFFDIVLSFGMSTQVMNQKFITEVWKTVRDLSNMVFIFALVWIAIATILQIGSHQAKDSLVKLIIAALLINFSLFFTRAIIDAGNLTALFFYDAFVVEQPANTTGNTTDISGQNISQNTFVGKNLGVTEVKGISQGFASFIDVNKLLDTQAGSFTTIDKGWGIGAFRFGGNASSQEGFDSQSRLLLLLFATIVLLGFLAWTLFTVSFLFITRVAILWLLMALSPLAFAAMIVPQGRSYAKKMFWGELISKAFCITVFMFLLWILMIFIAASKDTWAVDTQTLSFLELMIIMLLKYTVLISILKYAKTTTKKMCDSIGGISLDIGSKIASVAGIGLGLVGGGLGGTVLRKVVGGGAARNLETIGADGLSTRQRLASGNTFDRLRLRATEGAENSSFDLRKTRFAKTGLTKGLGLTSGAAALGINSGAGGFQGQVKREKEYYTDMRKRLGDITDKDPAKAAAAQAANKRFEDRLNKDSSSWMAKNIQQGSPYYDLLKRVKNGTAGPVENAYDPTGKYPKDKYPLITPGMASERMKEFEKQSVAESRDNVARGFGSAKQVAKAQAAQETAREMEKGAKVNAQRENAEAKREQVKRERDAQTAEYEEMKKKHPTINPVDPATGVAIDNTPTGWKKAADSEVKNLGGEIENLSQTIKERENRDKELSNTFSNLTVQRSVVTDSEQRNKMLSELQRIDNERKALARDLDGPRAELKKYKDRDDELRTLSKLADSMNRYAQRDVTDYNTSSKT